MAKGAQAAIGVPVTEAQAQAVKQSMRARAARTAERAVAVMSHGLGERDEATGITPVGSARLLKVMASRAVKPHAQTNVKLKGNR